MDETVRNLIHYVGLSLGQALAMASANPARALGLEMELGQIAPGYRASLTLLDSALAARGVCVDGLLF
jgi:N-acetylglucosamine-6-phosphate deacetylase